eukprot:TRINITY_DN4777_c0_g1_i1.p1 TRINITY_DN4777_c0_g1~~TRINITY_DN4777_c0_g1_i1.p1  ORF type:complete len:274 (-),score=40.48 TRINITY_DN4777_c0_g1_i1:136-957(-)
MLRSLVGSEMCIRDRAEMDAYAPQNSATRAFLPDPFQNVPALSDWLSDYEKRCPPAAGKVAAPLSLVRLLHRVLDEQDHNAVVLSTATKLGFWYLLRSIEYTADDEGNFDPKRSLTWKDLILRDIEGNVLTLSRISQAHSITIRIYSGKGSLHTCTRTLKKTPDIETCAVAGLIALYESWLRHFKRAPRPTESLFLRLEGTVLSRTELAEVLKAAAVACGVHSSRVATHSLRRGGASHYAASDGYKVYVSAHADMMHKGNADITMVAPVFELH